MNDRSAPATRVQLLELGVFLFLILPSMALSSFVVRQGRTGFVLTATATMLRDLSLLALIFYFLWRNGEPPRAVGWSRRNPGAEAVIGAALFPVMFFALSLLQRLLVALGFTAPSTALPSFLKAGGAGQTALAVVLVAVVAVSEETIFRGYLCLRLRALTGSTAAAVVLSAAVFSLGHGYEGSAGVITVGVLGAALAVVYLWRSSLVAPMVMHFLQDFLAIVVLPNVTGGG